MSLKKGSVPPSPNPQIWPPYPQIEEPSPEATVWRYIDLPKFIDLLDTQTLWFSRVAVLGDPFEGSYPIKNAVGPRGGQYTRLVPVRKRSSDLHYINCWHIGEHESAAMWELYATKGAGIAVRTCYADLKESILEERLTDPMYFARVKYIDYETEGFDGPVVDSDGFSAFMYKRKSFAHEHELRIITTNRLYTPVSGAGAEVQVVAGIRFSVDLKRLLRQIVIAPTVSTLFANSVQAVVSRFGLATAIIRRSDLERSPIY